MTVTLIISGALLLGGLLLSRLFIPWGIRWGATPEECAMRMKGDAWLDGGPPHRARMTRAVSIRRPPDQVWPWLAQAGRGAGWYSYDLLDNGGKPSARHIVSWIPEARLGDASAIGYLRHLDPGHHLAWWLGGLPGLGANMRMATDYLVTPEPEGSRLVIRISCDVAGHTAGILLWMFKIIDTIMARKQLLGIKERVERYGARTVDPDLPESGARDQFQRYETIYATGETAGIPGKENARHWHRAAEEDGVFPEDGAV